MSLKRQLLLASLLMLLIPWAGLQFVLDLDAALREQATRQLQGQAARLANALAPLLAGHRPVPADSPVMYAMPLRYAPNIDGYNADWPGYVEDEQDRELPQQLHWQSATDGRNLYLFIQVPHPASRLFHYGAPQLPHEQIRLYWQHRDGRHAEQVVRTQGPGPVDAMAIEHKASGGYRVTGYWQMGTTSYQVELKLPLPPAGTRFGFEVLSPLSDATTAAGVSTYQHSGTPMSPLPLLVTRYGDMERLLVPLLADGQRASITEPAGWIVAREAIPSRLPQPDFERLSPLQIVEQISLNVLRYLIRGFQPEPLPVAVADARLDLQALPEQGLVRYPDSESYLLVRQPLSDGRELVLEQSLDQLLALSGNTLGTVIARSTVLVVLLMLILLGYASWLSWRITRLQRAVNASVDDDGRIIAPMPAVSGRDELADLARHFAQLVSRVEGYNRYLESFSRRLSHELKTPVAVVRSSLENLSHATRDEDRASYMTRASQATDRLSQILQGMSEAARLEQSFDHAENEDFDLAEVAMHATAAYQQLDPDHRIVYQGAEQGCPCHGSPELIVQLLDKLVDNARDFTPAGGLIEVRLTAARSGGRHELAVFNEGSRLPDNDQAGDIFSPFVSLRSGQQQGHLGQGLLIVQLIAGHHGGQVNAQNEDSGVAFRVRLPAAG